VEGAEKRGGRLRVRRYLAERGKGKTRVRKVREMQLKRRGKRGGVGAPPCSEHGRRWLRVGVAKDSSRWKIEAFLPLGTEDAESTFKWATKPWGGLLGVIERGGKSFLAQGKVDQKTTKYTMIV